MIDTHVHLIEPDRFAYPWLADVRDLDGTWNLARWSVHARRAGIQRGIFMEVDVAESDRASEALYFYQVAADPASLIDGVVAACRPEYDGFEAQLDALDNAHLVGLRRVFHVAPEGTLDSPNLVDNLRKVGERDLTFDLCLRPDQLERVLRIIDACPNTQFVLDHCGNPPIRTPAYAEWKANIRALALRPNLVCKVSGLVNHIPEKKGRKKRTPLQILEPVLDWVAGKFGSHRILFGSDWPVSTLAGFELEDWASLLGELTEDWSEAERKALFLENAERVYGVR